MKKIILILTLTFTACNFQTSDISNDLPLKYQFINEGGNQNRVIRDNELIIDSGAVDFSYNNKFIFFSVDTTYSMEPKNIAKEKLIYFIHNIKEDTLSKPLSFWYLKKFIVINKIDNRDNILIKN